MKRWKKLFRILITIGGLTWVILNLNWQDQVEFPAGYVDDDAVTVAPGTIYRVIEEDVVSVAVNIDGSTLEIPRAVFDGAAASPQFRLGILSVVADADAQLLVVGLLLIAPIHPLRTWRWHLLLTAQGFFVRWGDLFKVHMASLFVGALTPGATGSEVAKIHYSTRTSTEKVGPAIAVIVDRAVGVLALLTIAALATLFLPAATGTGWETPIKVWALVALVVVLGTAYFSKWLRSTGPVKALVDRVSRIRLVGELDTALTGYRKRGRVVMAAFCQSLLVQVLFIASAVLASRAVGMSTPAAVLGAGLPLVFFAGAIPISIMGFGVMEPVAIALFAKSSVATVEQIVAMLVLVRLFQLVYTILGAPYLARGGLSVTLKDRTAGQRIARATAAEDRT
jgi:uncharacterized protein (TIRG00374 family)